MEAGITGTGTGISGLLLSLGILFTLAEKGIFSSAEAIDAIDIAMDSLKRIIKDDDVLDKDAIHSAEKILKSVRAQF